MKNKLVIPTLILFKRLPSEIVWVDFLYQIEEISTGIYDESLLPKVGKDQRYFQLDLILHEDECVNYYYNLMAEKPKLMVACETIDAEFSIRPVLITADFDYANAHLEMDSDIYLADIPDDIYQVLENFMVDNYHYEQRKKRRRTD